jgi:hypothetical protein
MQEPSSWNWRAIMSLMASLQGTWRLISFDIEPPDGPRHPWGAGVHGLLIYAPTGHMSVSINKKPESELESDLEGLFDSILFYSGTYQVEGDLIRHQVTEASNPLRIGREMIRYASFDGDRVTLTTPKESFGRAHLVWQKVSP